MDIATEFSGAFILFALTTMQTIDRVGVWFAL